MKLAGTRILLLVTIVLVCDAVPASGDDDRRYLPMSARLLVWDADRLGRLELRRPVGSSGVVECAVTPLARAGTRLTASNGSRAVASFIDFQLPTFPA